MGRKDLSAERREQIVEAFLKCASRESLKKATNRKIAQEAGVQLSALHHYFKNRTEMVEVLMDKVVTGNISKFYDSFSEGNSREEQVEALVEYLFVTIFDDNTGSLIYDLFSEAKRNQKVRKSFESMYERYRDMGVAQLEASGYGELLSDTEKRTFGTMIAGLQEGVLIQWDMGKDKVNAEAVRAMVQEIIFSFFKNRAEK